MIDLCLRHFTGTWNKEIVNPKIIKEIVNPKIIIEMSPFCDKKSLHFLPSTTKHLTKVKIRFDCYWEKVIICCEMPNSHQW